MSNLNSRMVFYIRVFAFFVIALFLGIGCPLTGFLLAKLVNIYHAPFIYSMILFYGGLILGIPVGVLTFRHMLSVEAEIQKSKNT